MPDQEQEVIVDRSILAEDADEFVARLRAGEHLIPVPDGYVCKDAYECPCADAANTVTVHARFSR